jgi:hypothetical protein
VVSHEERRDHRGREGDIEHCEQDHQDRAGDPEDCTHRRVMSDICTPRPTTFAMNRTMVKSKRRLLPVVGIALGILTVHRSRKRRSRTAEAESVEEGHDDPETATEHAAVAAEHARLAAEKATTKRGER